ncbi:hypothetical protein [Sphingobium sp.]|uniref:hypothetical protein n=1 Tax=Sphingobium sp. TaxID=1912891 RepID=UPI002E210155
MRILFTRTRIGIDVPTYAYRLFVPFGEISLERQALIAMQSDYGLGAGLLARLPDVIAPVAHLEAAPGLEKHEFAKRIDAVADRVGAILLCAAFPEMREPTMPFRLEVPTAPANARLFGEAHNLSGRYETLSHGLSALTPKILGLRMERDR